MRIHFLIIMSILSLYSNGFALEYLVPEASVVPAIDGVLSTGEWSSALMVRIEYPEIITPPNEGSVPPGWATPTSDADLSIDCYLMWDANHLYVAARVYDSDLNWLNASPGPYNSQDTIQFCFNPGNDAGHVSTSGKATIMDFAAETSDAAGPGFYAHYHPDFYDSNSISMNGSVLGDGYVIEFTIDLDEVGELPQKGQTMGLSFVFSDADGGVHQTLICDSSDAGAWAVTTLQTWNVLRFVGQDGCGTTPFDIGDINVDCKVDLFDFASLAADWLGCTDPIDSNCSSVN